ncbi:exodeoxyribonuclease VII small subunit [Listeria sp. FSL L7-0233]|uniref:Exodeoxyribonuclease 7 small subunit n=4 Tax=Listeria TaxID=1637 RepID=A0A7X1DMZ6_9LIST|nr:MULTISPECIES: exodeoxyribonuclease VII small subunit [Listeria]EFR87819.1 exodeoxyribonuclease VII, small subunit [Listeria marthii FSL S4-120]MBC1543843.1 exodeoxyribonuclease VII small subunit [Listeria cossartiae subsp. cossartiae]MBC1545815.1 exodeoxyribonuclease VII small subunit [Listeria cossartiae subsp. cossartiae]MBC1548654.1 exodeoxyribonuclease VII small subunit [Listeria cossartiae subsp. cossartiae]MBC1570321.1 exodeoxyribonuclease VII small subunit [Listeria cossartiae subsp.
MATKKKTFEEAIAELETIVEALENGSASLEDSLDMYQKGIELTKLCQDKLQAAEKRMAKVVTDAGEEIPFEADGE